MAKYRERKSDFQSITTADGKIYGHFGIDPSDQKPDPFTGKDVDPDELIQLRILKMIARDLRVEK